MAVELQAVELRVGQSKRFTAERFREIRDTSMRITAPLSAEDHMLQSMPDASPAKWHLAHTTWFFETFILAQQVANYRPFDERFRTLFNSYYKQLGDHPFRGARGLLSRPSLQEVHAYREHVEQAVLKHFSEFDEPTLELIELGLNHEQQHQELILTDVKHGLWSSPLRPPESTQSSSPQSTTPLKWIPFDGGIHSIGHSGEDFAFDNESPRHDVLLQDFQVASRAVTNGEYLEFMTDNGYHRPELWLSEGWDTALAQGWKAPLYWEQNGNGQWRQFFDGSMREIDPAQPVSHVSFFEADAFARWSGKRLPTEQEWEAAATSREVQRGTMLEDWKFAPQAARGDGLQQILGDVWEWTASPYVGYPGFKPAPGLVGEYNGKFMCNQMVLRGGSCVTPASHIRATYRNFFPASARWQFSGIRLAQS